MPGREHPDHDPLDAVLRPPIDETPEEKACRLAQEEGARRISQAIDESIRQERIQRKKMKVVRLLLLGQSESGAYRSVCTLCTSTRFVGRLTRELSMYVCGTRRQVDHATT